MLHKRAKSPELSGAASIGNGTLVDFIGMRGALEVVVQVHELPESLVADNAFERGPVPRVIRRPGIGGDGRRVRAIRTQKQARRVGNDAGAVVRDNSPVDVVPCHTGSTSARLHVANKVGGKSERAIASLARAGKNFGKVGPHVMDKVVIRLEATRARGTVVVRAGHMSLVFVVLRREELCAH